MSAEPTLVQLLAAIQDNRANDQDPRTLACAQLGDALARGLTKALPDHDPNTTGQVLLRVASMLGGLLNQHPGMPPAALLNIVAYAGERLYWEKP